MKSNRGESKIGAHVPNDYQETPERLTGRIPVFREAKPRPQFTDDEWCELFMETLLETEPVTATCQNSAEPHSQATGRADSS